MTDDEISAYVERALDAAERQGKGRIASDEQLEIVARIHAAHLAETASSAASRRKQSA
jgi:hypothetical protein